MNLHGVILPVLCGGKRLYVIGLLAYHLMEILKRLKEYFPRHAVLEPLRDIQPEHIAAKT